MPELFRRLQYLLGRRRHERELADDMEFHREMAAREGRSNFGNALHLREEAREAWGWTWIDRLSQDLRHAARMLRRTPGFTIAAVLMLAIGIGVNGAVFGFFNLLVLRPINVRDPATLLRFHRRSPTQYAFAVPYPEAAFFREHSRTLSAIIGVNTTSVSIEGEEKPADANFVTANFFRELGGASSLGRVLDPAREEAAGASPVIVLSHGFWQHHFGGDPSIVGSTLRINDKPAIVIGVANGDFSGVGSGLREPAFWAPITQQPYFVDGSRLLTDVSEESPGVSLWGRLRPGQNPKAAEEELRSLAAQLRHQYPTAIWKDERLPSQPGGYVTSMITGGSRGTGAEKGEPIYPVFALAGILTLLILAGACGNLGSLLLARGVARQREIAIRAAIGASNGSLIRQLFTESLLLALLGAAAGMMLGVLVLRGFLASSGAPSWLDAAPDWRVGAFALAAGFASAILFGFTTALQIGRQRRRANLARQVLVGAQVAASCVLLIVAGLLGRALDRAMSSSPGFEYKQVVSISPGLATNGYSPVRSQAYLDALESRVRALPGVQSVSLAQSYPLGHVTIGAGTDVNGHNVEFQVNHVSSEFFETMGIPILRGRALRPNERHAVVISESMARIAWPGEDPLDKSFTLGDNYVVVGISGNVRSVKFGDSDPVQAYFPIEDADQPSLSVLVKATGSPQDVARAAGAAARAQDPNTFPTVELLSDAYRNNLQDAEYTTLAVSALGSIAQLLACFGIIGVVSYAVSQRTKEIGIRMSLGAKPAQVLSVVLRHLSGPVLAGLIVGVAGAVGLAQLLRGRLYGISNLDPAAYVAAIAVFVVTVAMAAILPARRALSIDPLRALRHE
ncbi:MAG TPA: ABC transporter permease [Bryobacteraceae bacterium]|nr:ABC transporter permease [Bryobacteraceae bacterium]